MFARCGCPIQLSNLSVVFPAYNDGGTISSMVLAAMVAAEQVTQDYEIIVVNDGSRDYTGLLLDELAKRFPCLKVLHHTKNQGYGATLLDGFSAASKEWVFYTDGDAQYNPLELTSLVSAAGQDVDVVNGYKISRNDSLVRIVVGKLYHFFVKWTFGFQLRDVDCDFRLIRRSLFDQVQLESSDGTFGLEMVKKFQDAGFHFIEVPVHHYPRPYGVSQFFQKGHLLRTALQLGKLWWKLVVRKPAPAVNRYA